MVWFFVEGDLLPRKGLFVRHSSNGYAVCSCGQREWHVLPSDVYYENQLSVLIGKLEKLAGQLVMDRKPHQASELLAFVRKVIA